MKRYRIMLFLHIFIFVFFCMQSVFSSSKTYVMIVKDISNPYMIRMYEGFEKACNELGVKAVLKGPEANGQPVQSAIVEEAMARKADAIVIAANDKDALSSALSKARNLHVPVISLDSAINPTDREVHIQQVSPEIIGSVLIQAAAKIMGYQGEFVILSTTVNMPNQASWVSWMQHELHSHPEKYKDMMLVETAYGRDEYETSVRETVRLLKSYPDLKLIIAPTVVGLHAAAEKIRKADSHVKVVGLGLPSNMEPFIMDGTCPWMYLWSPSDLGYLAAYAANAAVDGNNIGVLGEILNAGMLGDRIVTESEDGGTEIVLGFPKMFDSTNVTVWKELF
jgi:rhamnose transport system substrate-binding protein